MLPDHYATLGVSPTSPQKVLRAAYVELMRRYHPDRNPSAAAAAQVRAITAAYAVIGVLDRRAKYDSERTQIRSPQGSVTFGVAHPQRRPMFWVPPLSVVIFLLLLWLLLPPRIVIPGRSPQISAAEATPTKDLVLPAPGVNVRALCTSATVSGLLRQELFRRAAQIRGSDGVAFERIASFSLIRFHSVLTKASGTSGKVQCDAFVALDLPPGLSADGGLRSFTGNVAYSLQSADSSNGPGLELITHELLISRLATVVQTSPEGEAIPASSVRNEEPIGGSAAFDTRSPSTLVHPEPEAVRIEPQRASTQQNPSFSCNLARSWAANSVCTSASLAALDRTMASLYGDSMERADPSQRNFLVQGDRRFLAQRDRCSSETCVQGAYLARIEEIQKLRIGR